MSIYYDFHKQSGALGDKEKVFARVAHLHTINTKDLFEQIEKASSLTRGDLKAALDAITEALTSKLSLGHRVHLDGLGYFSLAMQADVVQLENGHYKAKQPSIKNINFLPEKPFLQRFSDVSFTAKKYVPNSPRSLSKEDAQTVLKALFSEKPVFTAAQFAETAKIPLQMAYPILRELEESGAIRNVGSPRRKVYIRP